MNYYISDTHFFHENAIKFDSRPFSSVEEMNTKIKSQWNWRVNPADTVYFLGDFSFGRNPETIELLQSLNGHKILIKGNHDSKYLKDIQFANKWEGIYDYLDVKDEIEGYPVYLHLCHYPIIPFKNRLRECNFMFFGHVHCSTADEPLVRKYVEEAKAVEAETFKSRVAYFPVHDKMAERKIYNVGCMMPYMEYTPQTAQNVIYGGELYYDSFGKR